MASIWKHPNSKYFTACFRDHTGRQRRVSTKETKRRPAQKIADAYEAAARIRRTKSHTMRVIDRLHEEIGGQPIQRETLTSFATSWLATKKPEVSVGTYSFYAKSVKKLTTYLGSDVAMHPRGH